MSRIEAHPSEATFSAEQAGFEAETLITVIVKVLSQDEQAAKQIRDRYFSPNHGNNTPPLTFELNQGDQIYQITYTDRATTREQIGDLPSSSRIVEVRIPNPTSTGTIIGLTTQYSVENSEIIGGKVSITSNWNLPDTNNEAALEAIKSHLAPILPSET